MTPDRVAWRSRLETRQSIPILLGLVGVLALLLPLGYLYARDQILASARGQVAQLVGSIARQDEYNRTWLMRGMQPLLRLVSTFPHRTAREQDAADADVSALISDARGRQVVEVLLLDAQGTVTRRRYDSTKLLSVGPAPGTQWTRERILALQGPQWSAPRVDAARNLRLRYSMPILGKDDNGNVATRGVCSVSLAISWFADRVRSFSPFKNGHVFFLTPEGTWTLPPREDAPLAGLKARMLARASGENSLAWNGTPYVAVYMPMAGGDLQLGLLIPREDLLGDLDRLTHLLGAIGLAVLLLAAYSLHRTSQKVLRPLKPLGRLAARLARGELEADPQTPALEPATRFPDEAQRLRQATERLRQALRQRMQDLTLIGQTRERLFGEMALARDMQESMRPPRLPPAPDLEVAAFVHTAGDVCGDMYDYFFQGPRRLCCVMGNAAAHGVPAALLANRIVPLLQELLRSGLAPGAALENSNKVLGPAISREQHMVSIIVGILDLDDGRFRWASAGHTPPFRGLGQEVDQLEWTGNMPLGIRDEATYPEREIRLRPGETLLFVGPRLFAVQDVRGASYGEQALRGFLAGNTQAPADLVQALFARLRRHAGGPPRDDLTFFAMRWRGNDVTSAPGPQAAPRSEPPGADGPQAS